MVEIDGRVLKVEISVVVTQDGVTEDNSVGPVTINEVNSSVRRSEGSDVQSEATISSSDSVHSRGDDNGSSRTNFKINGR